MYEYQATYLSNYDGDTCKMQVDLGFAIHHIITLRLLGVDTYEMRDKDPAKKVLAQRAKEFVFNKLSKAKYIKIRTRQDEYDKYGRYLAHILYVPADDQTDTYIILNQQLIDADLVTGKWAEKRLKQLRKEITDKSIKDKKVRKKNRKHK
jgi:endonuclease YncB( thermonuclease family)